jgi:hypothetical protein
LTPVPYNRKNKASKKYSGSQNSATNTEGANASRGRTPHRNSNQSHKLEIRYKSPQPGIKKLRRFFFRTAKIFISQGQKQSANKALIISASGNNG